MTLQSLLNIIIENADYKTVLLLLLILSSVVQISPLKINPWTRIGNWFTCLLKWIGQQMMSDFIDKFDKLDNDVAILDSKLQTMDAKMDNNRIKEIRWKILDFSNSLTNRNRDKEEYENIYKIHEEYEELIEKHKLTNGKVTRAMRNIDKHYQIQEESGTL